MSDGSRRPGKPGEFLLFVTDDEKKAKQKFPTDFNGFGVDLSGQEVYVDAYKNVSKEGKKYLKVIIKPKQAQATYTRETQETARADAFDDF